MESPVSWIRRLFNRGLIVGGRYRVERPLGRGGTGTVYRARDLGLGRVVALKIVPPDVLGDPAAHERFARETAIVARLQHPSIVPVYDHGTLPAGGAYVAMELVRGEDLRGVLQREGALDAERTTRILTAVCSAVEAAHREAVLHRDLKPENILLPDDGRTDAKVLDFGLPMVGADAIAGTPAYMAPEQFRGAPPDVRTDVFSLGVIAFEMIAGSLPFGRGPLADIVLAHARGAPTLPPRLAPPAFERAIRSALDPDPDRRPASAQAFAHLIGAAAAL